MMYIYTHPLLAVVNNPSPSTPLYMQALMPSPEDSHDSVATDDDQRAVDQESPLVEGKQQTAELVGKSPPEPMDVGEGSIPAETYENPFLKPPRRIKTHKVL